jgi:hypothetical protein
MQHKSLKLKRKLLRSKLIDRLLIVKATSLSLQDNNLIKIRMRYLGKACYKKMQQLEYYLHILFNGKTFQIYIAPGDHTATVVYNEINGLI